MCSVKYRPEALASAPSGWCGMSTNGTEGTAMDPDMLGLIFKAFGYIVQIISNAGVLS